MPSNSERSSPWPLVAIVIAPVLASIIIYRLDSFDPAPYPKHELAHPLPVAAAKNGHILKGAEFLAQGKVQGPEDILYDSKSGIIYVSNSDGWIKRVTVSESISDSVVSDWVNTGGRPLGLAMNSDNNAVIVADSYKGLLKIKIEDGSISLLTDEAEGQKFMLTDGVDVAKDGTIYFTDASYKYSLHDYLWDILEGRPYGRLLSYDPKTKTTNVLVNNLYFANGVALSPNQDYVVFCETSMRRCRKYYIKSDKKGSIEKFIELPGLPDNIHYDGNGHFLIATPSDLTTFWGLVLRYPIFSKIAAMITKWITAVNREGNSGVFMADLEGKLISQYSDPKLEFITSGVKIGNHLYCGSIIYPHILRLNLLQYPANSTS